MTSVHPNTARASHYVTKRHAKLGTVMAFHAIHSDELSCEHCGAEKESSLKGKVIYNVDGKSYYLSNQGIGDIAFTDELSAEIFMEKAIQSRPHHEHETARKLFSVGTYSESFHK